MRVIRVVLVICGLSVPLGGCVLAAAIDLLAWAGCPAKSVPPDAASQRAVGCPPP